MVHAIADAIFGNPNKVVFKAISDAQRIPDVQSGAVDIVAHTMTITCERLQQVDFSTVYFEAGQRVLVQTNSTAKSIADLGGKKVCATTGSTSIENIKAAPSHPIPVAVPYWTDCLVLLQQGQVAAISTDDSILAGLTAQDPWTKIVGPRFSKEPYGLAISKTARRLRPVRQCRAAETPHRRPVGRQLYPLGRLPRPHRRRLPTTCPEQSLLWLTVTPGE